MTDQKIEIVEYDSDWSELFKTEADMLSDVIGTWVVGGIEHVGSTAIPKLAAKPIIDIMVGVESLDASQDCIDILAKHNYCYYPYKDDEMHWFCKPKPEYRTHHLHLIPYQSPLWQERIAFRDILRVNPMVREDYADCEKCNWQASTKTKESFIHKTNGPLSKPF